jgi:hypothetical protein
MLEQCTEVPGSPEECGALDEHEYVENDRPAVADQPAMTRECVAGGRGAETESRYLQRGTANAAASAASITNIARHDTTAVTTPPTAAPNTCPRATAATSVAIAS